MYRAHLLKACPPSSLLTHRPCRGGLCHGCFPGPPLARRSPPCLAFLPRIPPEMHRAKQRTEKRKSPFLGTRTDSIVRFGFDRRQERGVQRTNRRGEEETHHARTCGGGTKEGPFLRRRK